MADDTIRVESKWQSKVDALIRLAEDQAGKPEGDLAREKLFQIVSKYPAVAKHAPVRDFMLKDLGRTGATPEEAIAQMVADYLRRMIEAEMMRSLWGEAAGRVAGDKSRLSGCYYSADMV